MKRSLLRWFCSLIFVVTAAGCADTTKNVEVEVNLTIDKEGKLLLSADGVPFTGFYSSISDEGKFNFVDRDFLENRRKNYHFESKRFKVFDFMEDCLKQSNPQAMIKIKLSGYAKNGVPEGAWLETLVLSTDTSLQGAGCGYKTQWKNGDTLTIANYTNGKLNGQFIRFGLDKTTKTFDKGREISSISVSSNGSIKVVCGIDPYDGSYHCVESLWNDNIGTYRNGLRHGEWCGSSQTNENGYINEDYDYSFTYDNNIPTGTYIRAFFSNHVNRAFLTKENCPQLSEWLPDTTKKYRNVILGDFVNEHDLKEIKFDVSDERFFGDNEIRELSFNELFDFRGSSEFKFHGLTDIKREFWIYDGDSACSFSIHTPTSFSISTSFSSVVNQFNIGQPDFDGEDIWDDDLIETRVNYERVEFGTRNQLGFVTIHKIDGECFVIDSLIEFTSTSSLVPKSLPVIKRTIIPPQDETSLYLLQVINYVVKFEFRFEGESSIFLAGMNRVQVEEGYYPISSDDIRYANKFGLPTTWYWFHEPKTIYFVGGFFVESISSWKSEHQAIIEQDELQERRAQAARAKAEKAKSYRSNGMTCSWCKSGKYYGGSCNMCGSSAPDRVLESMQNRAKCGYCNGTRVSGGRTCPACKGSGIQSY